MRILEPAVRAVGQLSFRNKLRATAFVFGIPLLIAAGLLLLQLNARVTELKQERAALAVQIPALNLLSGLHQAQAASQAMGEGADHLSGLLAAKRQVALAAARELQQAVDAQEVLRLDAAGGRLLGNWPKLSGEIEVADSEAFDRLAVAFRGELEKLNENSGLLIDGDASSSRLLDIITTHVPGLIDASGKSAQIGSVVLVKKSIRGSRRTDLTLQRGNFDALVQWSIDGLQKVSRDHPALAATLGDASSRLNAAYLATQEAITIKMLDTTDFDMTPEAFIDLTARAIDETLAVATVVARDADQLLAARQSMLEYQRNAVLVAMAFAMMLIVAGFVAAYISIMRGLNGLSEAVNTMAAGDLSARVEVQSRDELGEVGTQFNQMASVLAQRTAELREKTNDIHTMLHEMQQGILTIVAGGTIHHEYSSYLETIFETREVAGRPAMSFLFGGADLGANALDQVEATVAACIGEDRMNFAFNSHLLVREIRMLADDGRSKFLELSWSPICNEQDVIEKILVVVRDVTELRELAAEAEYQKHELALIGQILHVSQEKFRDFVDGSRRFLADNEALLRSAGGASPELLAHLFRNMHTIKGNARTFGFLHLTNVVHEAEQAYDDLRRDPQAVFDPRALLDQLQAVSGSLDEYESLNDVKLGRKGPGRRGSAEKYAMVARADVERMITELDAIDARAARPETLVAMLQQVKLDLRLIGTETVGGILDGVFDSLPSLAGELGKEVPTLDVNDGGIHLRNQIADLMRNVFMHLYRNSLDHGIEAAAERLAAGKPAAGRISLSLELGGDRLRMRLIDDGRGLALARIRQKAVEKGVVAADQTLPDAEVAKLVFASGFSTASAVTEVSGRGVGMDAVRGFVTREGGEIELQLRDNREGADFRVFETIITLPAKFAVRADAPVAHAERGGPAAESMEHTAGRRLLETVLSLPGKLVAAN